MTYQYSKEKRQTAQRTKNMLRQIAYEYTPWYGADASGGSGYATTGGLSAATSTPPCAALDKNTTPTQSRPLYTPTPSCSVNIPSYDVELPRLQRWKRRNITYFDLMSTIHSDICAAETVLKFLPFRQDAIGSTF